MRNEGADGQSCRRLLGVLKVAVKGKQSAAAPRHARDEGFFVPHFFKQGGDLVVEFHRGGKKVV